VRNDGKKTTPLIRRKKRSSNALYDSSTTSTKGWVTKIILLGIVDAVAVFAAFMLFMQQQWLPLIIEIAVVALVNYIYLKRGSLPAKYLAPGLAFLVAFQISVAHACVVSSLASKGPLLLERPPSRIRQRHLARLASCCGHGLPVRFWIG
jgi:arabinogalactan oligomer/maltooligosaccharide transport system permease protein